MRKWIFLMVTVAVVLSSLTFGAWADKAGNDPVTSEDIPDLYFEEIYIDGFQSKDKPSLKIEFWFSYDMEELIKKAKSADARLSVETEIRVRDGGDWVDISNTEYEFRDESMKCSLLPFIEECGPFSEDPFVQIRCRIVCTQEGQEDLYSEYCLEDFTIYDSVTVPCTNPSNRARGRASEKEKKGKNAKKEEKCAVCGFCAHPLGICLFIWIGVPLVILAAALIIFLVVKKHSSGA
ncbi:MAG: hypothetical protein J5379_02595 [Clostridiales bacterium]|nr:hypothetical protein [Clostridiales bacterium]